MNVILDIDETFVQFVGRDDWEKGVPDADKPKYETTDRSESGFFILRPHFDKFFDFLFKNCRTVNLWTLSDADYAKNVAKLIERRGGNKKWNVANVWSEKDADQASDDYGGRKNIKWIRYEQDGNFMPFNTILVDDLPANTQNEQNIKNGIQLRPFNPLGEAVSRDKRTKTSIRDQHYTDLTNDDTLLKVIEKLKEVMEKPPFQGSTKINVGAGGKRKRLQKKTKRSKGLRRKTSRR